MFEYSKLKAVGLVAGLAGLLLIAQTANAAVQCQAIPGGEPKQSAFCGEEPGGGGGGGGGGTIPPPPTYTLQGVIQNQGYEYQPGPARFGRVRIRGYSRFANANNDRVDADYMEVRCFAYDPNSNYTTDFDSESNGALVDVHFSSPFVPGGSIGIRVNCTHYATFRGVTYNSTSTAQIFVPR